MFHIAMDCFMFEKMTLMENRREEIGFLLLEYTDDPALQIPHFIMLLLTYTITMVWNLEMTVIASFLNDVFQDLS